MPAIDLAFARANFPSLRDDAILLDNAGGSQVLERVADRVRDYLLSETVYPSGLTGVDLLRCPVPAHQFVDMGHFVICDAGEDPAQPGFGIDIVHAAGFNERIGDGCGVSAAL